MINDILLNLRELENLGYVRLQKHKDFPLTLANYTPIVQYGKLFGDYPLLRRTRGLIVDDGGKVIAAPFEKFFNYEEHHISELPVNSKVRITEKLDGSLIVLVKYQDQLIFSTRGSFYSTQAKLAQKLFNKKYTKDLIDEGKTYLFELIGPSNRIVVKYPEDKLVLLGIRNDETSPITLPESSPFEIVESFEYDGNIFGTDLYEKLKSFNLDDKEGFVISTDDDWRCKIKFEEYVKLHRIVTGVSTKTIWEFLLEGKDIFTLLEHTPDEFNQFVKDTVSDLQGQFDSIADYCKELADLCKDEWKTNPNGVSQFLKSEPSTVMHVTFAMLREKDWKTLLWKQLRPVYKQPFEER